MAPKILQGDTKSGKIGRVERALLCSASDADDASEAGGVLDEREKGSDEADAGVVV
jgi:hypothetical protein